MEGYMSTSKPWWKQPLRILDYNYLIQVDNYDFREYVKTCKELHANVVHFHPADGNRGGWSEDVFYFRTGLATVQHRDILAEAIPLLHEAGIKVIAYTCGHWFPKRFIDKHPDWWAIRQDGSQVEHLYGDDDTTTCVNTPWRDWAFTLVEDLFSYDIDGMLWDGPIMFLDRGACYCESCKAKFRQQYARDMPAWNRDEKEDWQQLAEFSSSSLRDFYRDSYEIVKKIKPDSCIYLNAGNVGEPSWLVGRGNRGLMPYQDMLMSEGGFMYGRVSDNMFKTTASLKLYETQAGGKPCSVAVSPAFGSWRSHHLSKPEMRVLLAESSFGGNPYAAMWLESGISPAYEGIADVYGFLEKNEAYYEDTRSAANVALFHSLNTVDNYTGLDVPYCDLSGMKAKPAEAIGNFTRSFHGFQEMLERLRVPFNIVDEELIEGGGLAKYDLLIMPNCACTSDALCKWIGDYVANGGTVIADFETSHLDDKGVRRNEIGLADVFGVSSHNETYGPRRWDFVHVCESSADVFSSLSQRFIPAPNYNMRVSATTGEVAAVFGKPLISNITKDYQPSDEPFLVVNRHGSGTSYYIPGTFSQMFAERHVHCFVEIVGGIIDREIKLPVEVSGPPHFINVSVRKQGDNRTLVQLVNYELRPVTEVIRALDLKIKVRTSAQVASVRALRLDKDLAFACSDDGVVISLPELGEFEVLAIDTV